MLLLLLLLSNRWSSEYHRCDTGVVVVVVVVVEHIRRWWSFRWWPLVMDRQRWWTMMILWIVVLVQEDTAVVVVTTCTAVPREGIIVCVLVDVVVLGLLILIYIIYTNWKKGDSFSSHYVGWWIRVCVCVDDGLLMTDLSLSFLPTIQSSLYLLEYRIRTVSLYCVHQTSKHPYRLAVVRRKNPFYE